MNIGRGVWIALLVLMSVPPAYSQEKQASPSSEAQPAESQALLKLQFLVTEYDGTKKVASLPYQVSGMTSHLGKRDSLGVLRVGARIPAATNEKTGEETYIDVGTNIDYWVWPRPDNRFLVSGTIELSSLFGHDAGSEQATKQDFNPNVSPILNQTRADFTVGLREGQAGEALSVTNPITGRVVELQITVDTPK